MYFKQLQHAVRRLLKTRILGVAQAAPQYAPQEVKQLAEAIVAFGRVRQQPHGSRQVIVGVEEMGMRLRETTHTIVEALEVLKDQGRAEETSMRGRWRLHLTMHREQGRDHATR
jgi:hypothetical protein